MKQQTSSRAISQKWYNSRQGALLLCAVAIALAYLAGSRAIFTGSLQQYVLTFVLVVIAGNRLLAGIHPAKAKGGTHD